jgi:exopolyphosphatase/guanosine-5'-triphosphate,3'-diphosphate pyrophosphatase
MTVRAAVLDVGSNSVRLLLLERMTPHGAVGERRATVTGLRKGAGADGSVAPDALERLDACLAGYADAIAAAGNPPVVAVGTAAVREAPNRDEISAVVRRRLGTDLMVVTGEQEATLAYRGARMALADPDGPCRMIDIGGASTEIVAGDASGPHHVVSLPLGVVRNAGDTVEGARLEALRRVADATTIFPADGPVIGLAGTVTQAAALCNGRYDPDEIHRQQLGRDAIERVLADAAALDLDTRRSMPGMHPDRADVIVNGMAILLGAMSALGVDEVIVSERDLLDGIAGDAALVPATVTE